MCFLRCVFCVVCLRAVSGLSILTKKISQFLCLALEDIFVPTVLDSVFVIAS